MCLSLRALYKTVYTLSQSYHVGHCAFQHWLLFGAPLWGVALSLGMAAGASSAEDSPNDDSDLSRTCTTTGNTKHPDDDSDLGRTHTATGQKKRSSRQTAAQREERLAVERLQLIPFFITSSYYTCTCHIHHLAYCTYIHTSLIFQIHTLLHGWGARHVLCVMRMSININIMCKHEVDKRSSSGTEYMHVRIPTCMYTLYATFYVSHNIIYYILMSRTI